MFVMSDEPWVALSLPLRGDMVPPLPYVSDPQVVLTQGLKSFPRRSSRPKTTKERSEEPPHSGAHHAQRLVRQLPPQPECARYPDLRSPSCFEPGPGLGRPGAHVHSNDCTLHAHLCVRSVDASIGRLISRQGVSFGRPSTRSWH